MESILLLAHTEPDGTLAKASLEALTAALSLGGEVTIGLVGADAQAAANQVAGAGAVRILAVTGDAYSQARYSTDAAAAEAVCKASGAKIVIAPSTSRWSRALPGVAHRLGGRVDTHATGLAVQNSVPAVTRWYYRQRMEAVLTRLQRPLDCPGGWRLLYCLERGGRFGADRERERRRSCQPHYRNRNPGAKGRRADHPAGCEGALRGGRGLDQEAIRWRGARA